MKISSGLYNFLAGVRLSREKGSWKRWKIEHAGTRVYSSSNIRQTGVVIE